MKADWLLGISNCLFDILLLLLFVRLLLLLLSLLLLLWLLVVTGSSLESKDVLLSLKEII